VGHLTGKWTVQHFIEHFEREASGTWTCRRSAELSLPGGRIQVAPGTRFTRGTTFMGIDLAKLLDEQHERQSAGQ